MTEKKFKPPERLSHIPTWLYDNDAKDDNQIAEDVIAMHYWHEIDKKAQSVALNAVKQHELWDVTLPLEGQHPVILAQYDVKLAEEKAKWEGIFENDVYARARALAQGADSAYDWTEVMQPLLEQAQMRIVMKVKKAGLLPYLEAGNVAEWLMSKKTPWDGIGNKPGNHYEADFLAHTLVPLLTKNGFSENLIIGVATNFYKARVAIPYIKTILSDILEKTDEIKKAKEEARSQGAKSKELDLFDEALTEAMQLDTRLHDAMEALVTEMTLSKNDGGMSVLEFKKHIRKLTKKNGTTKKAEGYTYLTATGGVVMVNCDSKPMFNAIKQMLGDIVDWHLATPEDLAVEVGKRLLASGQTDHLKEIMFPEGD